MKWYVARFSTGCAETWQMSSISMLSQVGALAVPTISSLTS